MTPDPLLDAIFQPGAESLRAPLAAARRRRIRRVLAPVVASAACLAVTMQLLVSLQPKRLMSSSAIAQAPRVQTIGSRPLLPRELVQSSGASVEIISTREAVAAPAVIADSELLASYHPGHAALVGASEERRLIEF